jgi:hypothetical protein
LGIDEACDVGDSCGVEARCSAYCDRIRDKCVDTPQYDHSNTECQDLCRLFPLAVGDPASNANTFECRMTRAISNTAETARDCRAAGRGGQDGCGSDCETYCFLMQAICTDQFAGFDPTGDDSQADQTACRALCDQLDPLGVYDPTIAGEFDPEGRATVQCRLWHIGAAAIDFAVTGTHSASTHCGHAAGLPPCNMLPAAAP